MSAPRSKRTSSTVSITMRNVYTHCVFPDIALRPFYFAMAMHIFMSTYYYRATVLRPGLILRWAPLMVNLQGKE